MAAFDHPLTDPYLSLIHQACLQASDYSRTKPQPPSPMASETSSAPPSAQPASAGASGTAPNPGPALISSSSQNPSTAVAGSSPLASGFEPLSSAEVLERVPSSVVRVLAAFGPAIHLANRFVRLATWTGGPSSGGSSMLLLVSWWLVCAFGYEVLRYAPQALVLAYIAHAWVRKQLGTVRPTKAGRRVYDRHDVVSAAKINATLLELSELADFFAVVRRSVLVPTVQLLSWDPAPNRTKAAAAFLVITWPLWLLAFLPWDDLKLPILVLPVSVSAILRSLASLLAGTRDLAAAMLGPDRLAALSQHAAPAVVAWGATVAIIAKTPLPFLYRAAATILAQLRLERWTNFSIRLLPPYPIAALSLRSVLCLTGTLALTWCSPWCGLIRQAVWKSATIRRVARGTGRILSGQRPFRDAWGRGKLDGKPPRAHLSQDRLYATTTASSAAKGNASKPAAAGAKPPTVSGTGKVEHEGGFTRHEDVIYQFSIYENQRWWVGLDWTAALLPQERPSWSDESNNPVSPPSSFSLPPARITLTPSPTPSNPKAFQRRTVKWQWLDSEWTIAGVGPSPLPAATSVFRGSAKDASDLSAKSAADAGGKPGSLGEAFNRIRNSRASLPGSPASPDKADASAVTREPDAGGVGAPLRPEDDEDWDVDNEGWQYGDNAWEKMSKKAGLGRYTRRRKWVRRAVLIEVVERGVDAPASPLVDPAGKKKDAGPGASSSSSPQTAKRASEGGLGSAAAAAETGRDRTKGLDDAGHAVDVSTPAATSAGLRVDAAKASEAAMVISPPTSPTSGRVDLKSRLAKATHS
ncbi:hypothetical protein ACQY0O_004460 [Thecaphora frezii]